MFNIFNLLMLMGSKIQNLYSCLKLGFSETQLKDSVTLVTNTGIKFYMSQSCDPAKCCERLFVPGKSVQQHKSFCQVLTHNCDVLGYVTLDLKYLHTF